MAGGTALERAGAHRQRLSSNGRKGQASYLIDLGGRRLLAGVALCHSRIALARSSFKA